MAKDRLTRKLAVILHADVVGSTAQVQQNEPLAHESIYAVFNRFSEDIKLYGGVTRELCGARNTIGAIAVVVFIITGIALMWLNPGEVREEPASVESMAFHCPTSPPSRCCHSQI